MRLTTRTITPAAVVAACLFCFSIAEAKKPVKPPGGGGGGEAAYSIVPFDANSPLSEGGEVADLNDAGQAVGWVVNNAEEYQSYHLDLASGAYTALPGDATAINNHGHIVGNALTQGGGAGPNSGYYMGSLAAIPVMLPPLAGGDECRALDINDDQVIVGRSGPVAVAWRPVVDTSGNLFIDGPVPLYPFDGDSISSAVSLSDPLFGPIQIVGYSHTSVPTPVVWSIELNSDGTLSSPSAPSAPMGIGAYDAPWGVARAVNAFGDICGDYDGLPFVMKFDGSSQTLSFPRNTQGGWASDINDLGETVGELDVQKIPRNGTYWPAPRAHLWRADGTTVDLETLIDGASGWDQLWGANRINNSGVISGRGRFGDHNRPFIMTPN